MAAISTRTDRVIARLRTLDGYVLLFSHGHFLRVLAARWLGLPVGDARLFVLSTAALSILGCYALLVRGSEVGASPGRI